MDFKCLRSSVISCKCLNTSDLGRYRANLQQPASTRSVYFGHLSCLLSSYEDTRLDQPLNPRHVSGMQLSLPPPLLLALLAWGSLEAQTLSYDVVEYGSTQFEDWDSKPVLTAYELESLKSTPIRRSSMEVTFRDGVAQTWRSTYDRAYSSSLRSDEDKIHEIYLDRDRKTYKSHTGRVMVDRAPRPYEVDYLDGYHFRAWTRELLSNPNSEYYLRSDVPSKVSSRGTREVRQIGEVIEVYEDSALVETFDAATLAQASFRGDSVAVRTFFAEAPQGGGILYPAVEVALRKQTLVNGGRVVRSHVTLLHNYRYGDVDPAATAKVYSAYPNPARDVLDVIGFPQATSPLDYRIVSSLGQVVQVGKTADGHVEVDYLPSGSYVLIVSSNGEVDPITLQFQKQ